jgi:cobalt transporter subunit CbtA
MQFFPRILLTALLAGLLSGAVATVLHNLGTVPIILQAETYEQAAEAHGHPAGAPSAVAQAPVPTPADTHAHDDEGWSPADGAERIGYTLLADLLTGIGFALLLVSGFALRAPPGTAGGAPRDGSGAIGWRQGLFWGLAGFAVFTLAPGLGLPPELPGTEAAPLAERQVWWLAAAALTATALALIAFTRHPGWAVLAVLLLILPHLAGAPQPAEHGALAPPDLARRFAVTATVTSLLFWVVLGTAAGWLYGRPARRMT